MGIFKPDRLVLSIILVLFVALDCAAVEPVVRELLEARRQIKARGFPDYVPVAYGTMGIKDDVWTTLDNHARAHFTLYLKRDCTHFVFRWEIPHLIAAVGEEKESTPVKTRPVRLGGPGGGQIMSFRNQKANILCRSCAGGYLPRTCTRGPFNRFLDRRAPARDAKIPQWGALIYCALFLAPEDAALGKPIAIYHTEGDEEGDHLSSFAVMDIPDRLRPRIKRMATGGATAGVPAVLHWQVKANLCNVSLKSHVVELKEMKVTYERALDGMFTVCDYALIAMSDGLSGVGEAIIKNCLLEAAGIETMDQWDLIAWMIMRPVEKAIENIVSITNVRVAHMADPMPFYVSPWTTVSLTGPSTGTDTWNRIEMRASYRHTEEYEWTVKAGALTQWRARLATRPSVITMAYPQSYGYYRYDIAPTHIEIALDRTDENWERIDRHLVEHYLDGVNAPCFLIQMNPQVNYEITGVEALRVQGEMTTQSPSISRRELFHSASVCTGVERLPRIGWDHIKKRSPSLSTAALAATGQEVEVTFNPDVLPLTGDFFAEPQKLQFDLEPPAYSIGHYEGDPQLWVSDYEDTWWYQTVEYNWNAVRDFRAYWTRVRKEQRQAWRASTDDQVDRWREMLGSSFHFDGPYIAHRPPAQGWAASHKIKDRARIAYLPTFEPIHVSEPIVWERVGLSSRAKELPDLKTVNPTIRITDDEFRIEYTDPRTDVQKAILIPQPKRIGGSMPSRKTPR